MAKFIIEGQKTLTGQIEVNGAKNAALKMIAASIVINNQVILHNIPDILDIKNLCAIIEKMGAIIKRDGHDLTLDTTNLIYSDPDPALVKQMRTSVVLIGPMLARFGKIKLPHPGGDKIGKRPIDLHLKAFETLGATLHLNDDYDLEINMTPKDSIIHFDKITVTGTENVILFAVLHPHTTVIENAAIEPEVVDLISFLNKAGANIKITDRIITIQGKDSLHEVEYTCLADRLEAATFAVLAAASRSDILINNIKVEHLNAFLVKLSEIGVKYETTQNSLHILPTDYLKATNLETAEYPGLSTDWQPPLGLLLTQAQGKSLIKENIWENRLGYLKELQQMGANINMINKKTAEITGPSELHGEAIQSLDIRAGATMIIAGLIAQGKTIIDDADNIDRGYEKIEERFNKLGAKIERIPS